MANETEIGTMTVIVSEKIRQILDIRGAEYFILYDNRSLDHPGSPKWEISVNWRFVRWFFRLKCWVAMCKRIFRGVAIFSLSLIVLIGSRAQAEDPPRSISPYYIETARQCRRILDDTRRWEMLPQPIDNLRVRPDRPPCFEILNDGTTNNAMPNNAQSIRWANRQRWDGQFLLLLNTDLAAMDEDQLWLRVRVHNASLRLLCNGVETLYRPPDGTIHLIRNRYQVALAGKGRCWMASESGLMLFEDGKCQRVELPDWPDRPVVGVVSDRLGRVVAWSGVGPVGNPHNDPFTGAAAPEGTTVAFFDSKEWKSVKVEPGGWTCAAIRADGSLVLADRSKAIVVDPPDLQAAEDESEPEDLFGPERQAYLKHRKEGHRYVGDWWIRSGVGAAVSPDGGYVYVAQRVSGGPYGLVRDRGDGAIQWIRFPEEGRLQIVARSDREFLVLTGSGKMYGLDDDSLEPRLLSVEGEFQPSDILLGCDHKGRVYLQRQYEFMMFRPEGSPEPIHQAEPISQVSSEWINERMNYADLSSAVDTEGRIWFIKPNGTVMKIDRGEVEPREVDERIDDGWQLWPGVDGSMLIQRRDGLIAIANGDGEAILAHSMPQLAEKAFDILLAEAPRSTCDRRVSLMDQRDPSTRYASPWLAVGRSLYYTNGKSVLRIRNAKPNDPADRSIEVKTVCEGEYHIFGPLACGQLLLAKLSWSRVSDMKSWYIVDNPDGQTRLELLQSPPKEHDGGTLLYPAAYESPWLLDSRGKLWLHQGYARVYHTQSPDSWPMISDLGLPWIEHPKGTAWSKRISYGFKGYEIVSPSGERRRCSPTVVENLTPLASLSDTCLLCNTTNGIAMLYCDGKDPEKDGVMRAVQVDWRGRPSRFIGVTGEYLVMLVQGDRGRYLVRVELP